MEVKIWSLCSVSSTLLDANLEPPFRTLAIKWEVKYNCKEVFLRLPSCVVYYCVCYHCVGMYPVYICIFLHESEDEYTTCIPAEIAVVPCPSGYLMLFWVLALTCLQNVEPDHLILGDIAVWLCTLFGRFRRNLWIRLMWIDFRCRWPHNLLHQTAQTVHVGTQ